MPVTVDHPFDYSQDEDVLALKEENKKLQKEILILELQKENNRLKSYKIQLAKSLDNAQNLNGITW